MKATIAVKLERPAKKSGGDRYAVLAPVAILDNGEQVLIGEFQVYIPQTISRAKGIPLAALILTISDNKEGGKP